MPIRGSSLAMGLWLVACAGCAPAPAGRYLYRVTCDAELARFDTFERKETGRYELAHRPGAEGLIPAPVGVVERCLANGTVFDPVSSRFYTIAPSRLPQGDSLTQSYRLSSFSVPEIELASQAPAGNDLDILHVWS